MTYKLCKTGLICIPDNGSGNGSIIWQISQMLHIPAAPQPTTHPQSMNSHLFHRPLSQQNTQSVNKVLREGKKKFLTFSREYCTRVPCLTIWSFSQSKNYNGIKCAMSSNLYFANPENHKMKLKQWLCLASLVQFSPLTDQVIWKTWWLIRQRSSSSLFCEKPLWAVLAWIRMSTLWHWPSSISSDGSIIIHPPPWCPDGFGGVVVVCDMSKLCECPSLDSCQKRFLWSHKEVDLSLHPAAGLRGVEKFPQALDLKSLDPFLRVSKQGPGLIAIEVYL